jgi:endo-1,4-beta-xylanase
MKSTLLFRGCLLSCAVAFLGCTTGSGSDPVTAPQGIAIAAVVAGAPTSPTSIQNDFEDGTTQGWQQFGGYPPNPTVANSTDIAFDGTHSLKTTNRSATYQGPGLQLTTSQVQPGVSYSLSLEARLVAGQSPTSLKITVQRTLSDGSNAYDTAVNSTNVTADGWVKMAATYSYSATNTSALVLYVESASANASYYIDSFSLTQITTYDFEDGTAQGWQSFGLSSTNPTVANSTDIGFNSAHSLKTTNRTANWMGPSLNVQSLLTKGATYQVTLSARLVTGQPADKLQMSVKRTTGGNDSFDNVGSGSNVDDSAWVTMSGIYTFTTDNTGLTFYVQSSGTSSFYIDTVSFVQVAPPPGAPGNTTGATSTFESNTVEGWTAHYSASTIAATSADARSGSFSLLASNRTASYQGPAYDVTNVMFNGSRYVVSLWAKVAPGQSSSSANLILSLDAKQGTLDKFITLVPATQVTSAGWVHFLSTYTVVDGNSSLTLYVESDGASAKTSFYIDDFSITYVPPGVAETNIPSVYQTLSQYFPVGAAVVPSDIQGQSAVLLAKHFNSMTSGNDMKWDTTEPTEGKFNFTQADAEVAFAQANGMLVRGHTLVWHNQIPAWVFKDASGNQASRDLLIQRIQNHIQGVMGHFKGKISAWDVVNEPMDPSDPSGFRQSPWYTIIGPEYISIALTAARAADPNAKLYINDYDTTNPPKRDALLALVNSLKTAQVPLDGVGHQMHSNVEYPSPQSLIDAVNLFDAAGVDNSITEMDVSIYSGTYSTPFPLYQDIPQSRHIMVGYSYMGFFNALKQLGTKVKSVTIWGTSDDKTWLNSLSKTDAPLLFDWSLKHKYAYWGVVDPLQLPGADLSATVTAASPVSAGQPITYGITVTNNADQHDQAYDPSDDDLPATNVTLTIPVPARTSYSSLTPAPGWSCSSPGAGGSITCTTASLAVGASAPFTLTVSQNDCSGMTAPGIVASATVGSATADPNPANNGSSAAALIIDTTPPQMSLAPSIAMSPPDHTYRTFTVANLVTSASDNCDGSVGIGSVVITQATSDEPDNGNGDGNTVNDIVIASDCRSVQLRSERAGPLNGRVYNITLRVTDASGNVTTQTVKETVPLSDTSGPAIDDGVQNTVRSACH